MTASPPPSPDLSALQTEIQTDQQTLEARPTQLQIAPSRPRQALAWIAGKRSDLRRRTEAKEARGLAAARRTGTARAQYRRQGRALTGPGDGRARDAGPAS